MNYAYLLDTNIISNLIRNPMGIVAQQIRNVGEASICTSIIVACELRYGVQKRGSMPLEQQLERILRLIPILPVDAPVDRHYAEIRTHLERSGTLIGPNDLLIAAHAQALNLTLVTANLREFERVPNLSVTNWL